MSLSGTEIGLLIGVISTAIISIIGACAKNITRSQCCGSLIEFRRKSSTPKKTPVIQFPSPKANPPPKAEIFA